MKKQNFLFALLGGLLLAGCSSSTTKNANQVIDYDADTSYRETEEQLSESLDMPPNLFALSKGRDDFNKNIGAENSAKPEAGYRYIPTYRAKNVSVHSNLSERWLEIKGMKSQKVWKGVEDFLVSMGFTIKESRKDTGFIRTEYMPRKELVPLDDQGPLTRLLNSWRPELAEGVYDRIIARVSYDETTASTNVYFYHAMVIDPSQAESDELVASIGSDGWKIKPFNPMIEAEALYQAMIFFGATQSQALAQVESTVFLAKELGEGEEVSGVEFKASREVAWDYLISMIYRANWSMDQMKPQSYEAWIKIPDEVREDNSLSSQLSFWSDTKEKVIPQVVRFYLEEANGDQTNCILKLSAVENEKPLTGKQREYILKSLGLLAESE